MQQFDFVNGGSKSELFQYLILTSSVDIVDKLASKEGFDSSKLNIELSINGVDMKIGTLENALSRYYDNIEDYLKRQLEYFQSEEAVKEKAEELIKEKIGNAYEALQELENNLWKLEI